MTGQAPEIPGYAYVRLLGHGGFSDVYLYRQALPLRDVAIKVLRADMTSDSLRRQFTAEANLMAKVSTHPAIAAIHAAGVNDHGQPYLVMEYCSGGGFGATFRTQQPDIADVLHIGVRLASALEAAHRAGIIHRDVKPANVLINDYGSAVLTDFGISAIDDEFPDATMARVQAYATVSASTLGESLGMSIPWTAPESFEDPPRSDVRSDVYSLAATLYSLIEGRSPFETDAGRNGGLHLIPRIRSGAIGPFTRDDVPDAVENALRTGMSLNSADRFPSALAFAEHLQGIEHELGYPMTRIEVPVASPTLEPVASTIPTGPRVMVTTDAETVFPSETGLESRAATSPGQATDATTPAGIPTVPLPAAKAHEQQDAGLRVDTAEPAATAARSRPTTRPRRRIRPIAWVSIIAAVVVLGLVIAGLPWMNSVIASSTPTPTALIIETLNITKATPKDDDYRDKDRPVWLVDIPEDLAPPAALEGRIVQPGASKTLVSAESTVRVGYDTSPWYRDLDVALSPTFEGDYAVIEVPASKLKKYLGVDVVGLPVGTLVLSAGVPGFFANDTPFEEAIIEDQLVMVRILSLT